MIIFSISLVIVFSSRSGHRVLCLPRVFLTFQLTTCMLSQLFWSGYGRTFQTGRSVLWCHQMQEVPRGWWDQLHALAKRQQPECLEFKLAVSWISMVVTSSHYSHSLCHGSISTGLYYYKHCNPLPPLRVTSIADWLNIGFALIHKEVNFDWVWFWVSRG